MTFSPPFDLLPPLMGGMLRTLELTAGGIVLATGLSLLAGLGSFVRFKPLRWLAVGYVEIFRGTSALVQLYWCSFVFPRLFDINVDAMTVGIVVLGLNSGAYGSEIVRGALGAVAQGQQEAATALGFSPRQSLWRILLPQAMVAMLPPMTNVYIELMKNTALASLIFISELTFTSKILIADTLRTGAILAMVLLLYFAVSQVISLGMRLLEFRLSRGRDLGGLR